MRRVWPVLFLVLIFFYTVFPPSVRAAGDETPKLPRFLLNGAAVSVTIQDLSGLGTRPLRLLVEKNNKARGEPLIQVYALGAHEGDALRMEWGVPAPGMRATLYRVLHDSKGGRYLSMPVTGYFEAPGEAVYQEKVEPFREEFFILVFEKTGDAAAQNMNIRYFEEPGRRLSMASYKTNLLFSSLRFKMKDPENPRPGVFIERDAQVLVDRFIGLQRIFLFRIWKSARS